MEILLIGDPKVKAVSVEDDGNPFVDLEKSFPELHFDHSREFVQKKSKSISLGRQKVGELLVQAQRKLPDGMKFLIKECYRPLWIQREFFEGYLKHLADKYPSWTEDELYRECSKLNAPIDVAPHSTGGAVDLILIDGSGAPLDMGTRMNAKPIETDNATYTNARNISVLAKRNRSLLIEALTAVGFVNYPTEWWHWSYGDKYWACLTEKPFAIYSSMEDFPT